MLPKTKFRKLSRALPEHKFCMRHLCNSLLWSDISHRHDLKEDFIREFKNSINWKALSGSANLVLDDNFLMEYEDKLDWHYISAYKNLELKDLRRWKNKLNWRNVSRNQKLTEEVIREFSYLLDWDIISSNQKLSESIMEDMIKYLKIDEITRFQKLSESFIEKHWDKFLPYINFIARHQKLSAPFVWKHIDVLDIGAMAKNSKININLREKFQYLVRTKAVEPWQDYWYYNNKFDPLHKNNNLKNKQVVEWLNIEVQ